MLFQLPPNFKADPLLLAAFLEKLPRDIPYAFEFRNKTWLTDEVNGLLEKHGIALCLAESEKFEVPEAITANFVYVRLRKDDYSLAGAGRNCRRESQRLRADGRDVFVFFKHEETPAGAVYAEELLKAVA